MSLLWDGSLCLTWDIGEMWDGVGKPGARGVEVENRLSWAISICPHGRKSRAGMRGEKCCFTLPAMLPKLKFFSCVV